MPGDSRRPSLEEPQDRRRGRRPAHLHLVSRARGEVPQAGRAGVGSLPNRRRRDKIRFGISKITGALSSSMFANTEGRQKVFIGNLIAIRFGFFCGFVCLFV